MGILDGVTSGLTPGRRRRRRRLALALVLAAGIAWNVVGNLLLPHWLYVPGALATALAVLLVAVAIGGCGPRELGVRARDLGPGLRWGLAAALVVAIAYAIAAVVPATRPWLADSRADLSLPGMLFAALVRVPLGTVALEETLFRGVLLALLARDRSVGAAVGWSSVLFALWHVLPSRGAPGFNPVLADLGANPLGHVLVVTALVAFTGLAGVVFCWLRLASGSLLAPMLLHTATNSLAYIFGWALLRLA